MKKRILCAALALTFVLSCAVGLTSCGKTNTLDYASMDLSEYITLGQYTNLVVDAAKVDEITPEKVAEEIMKLRVQNATGKLITDRAVEATDTIKFSYAVKTVGEDGNVKVETAKEKDTYDISVDGTSETATVHINKKEFGDALIGKSLDKPFDVTISEKSGEETVETVYEVVILAIYDYHKTTDLKEDGTTEPAVLKDNSVVSISFTKTAADGTKEERTEDRVNFASVGKLTWDWYQADFINALIKKKVGDTVEIEIKDAKFEVKINYIYAPVDEPAKEDEILVGLGLGFDESSIKKNTDETDEAFAARVIEERLKFISEEMELEETLKKGEGETDEDFSARIFDEFTKYFDKTLKEEREEQILINRYNAIWEKAIANATVKKYHKKSLKNYVKETIDNLNTDYYTNEQYYEMYESYGLTGYYTHYETLGEYIAANTDYSKDNYKAEIEKKSEEVAKEAMVLYAIVKELKLSVSDAEFDARMAEYAEEAGYEDSTAEDGTVTKAVDAFLAAYANYYTPEQLRQAVLWEKLVAELDKTATVNFK